MHVSIILPTYNERGNLRPIVARILAVFQRERINGEILVIDDNSPDGTGEVADELAREHDQVRAIHRRGKLGLGTAFRRGLAEARGGIIMEMDADLSHDPKYIPRFLAAMKTHDFAIGSRNVPGGGVIGWPVYRKMISRVANTLSNIILGTNVKDKTSGYRAYRREVLDQISWKSTGYSFLVEIMYKLLKRGYRLKEIPIQFKDRERGKSKLTLHEVKWFVDTILRLRINRIKNGRV